MEPTDRKISIIERSDSAIKEYGELYGFDLIELKPEHIEALRQGKMLAWNDEEYSTFVMLSSPNGWFILPPYETVNT